MDVVGRIAADRGATLLGPETVHVEAEMIEGRARLQIETDADRYGPFLLALRGEHQVGNAVVAIRLLEATRREGLDISRAAVERGLAETEWPARLELITLPGGKSVLLDAAHNPEGAAALAAYLRRWHPERPALVTGIMRDKDADEILRPLLPCVSRVFATAAPTPRAMSASQLRDRIGATVTVVDDPLAAVDAALQSADSVCVAGSIFLAGAVRDELKQRAILL